MTNQPSANRLFLLGPPSPPHVKLFHQPRLGNGIQAKREARDNWNAFYFFLLLPTSPPSVASANYLCASYTLYMLDVSPAVTPRAPLPSPLSGPSPSSSRCPSKFPGDFISPVSNRISTQFAMLGVTLLLNSTVDRDTS